jgi:beta-lactamase regulating signal transducer with metallopeptidase domain
MIVQLLASPWLLVEVLGWTLFHSTWQLAIIAILVGCILELLPSSRAKYRTAFVGLLLMAITPVAFFVWSISSNNLSATSYSATSADSILESVESMAGVPATQPLEKWEEPIVAIESDNKSFSTSAMSSASARRSYVVWLVPCWLCGVLLLSLRQLGGWYLAVRVVRHSALIKTHAARDCLDRLTQAMKIDRVVRLFSSTEVTTPMVFGVLRPCLIVPASLFSGLTPEQMTAIFAHELAHLRRNDFLQNLLQTFIETMLFFHPGVWWISRVIRLERELLCDDLSVDIVGQPVGLAEALLAIQSLGLDTRQLPVAQAATGHRDSAMLHRIRRLVAPNSTSERRSGLSSPIALRALVAAVLIASLAAVAPLAIAIQSKSEKSTQDDKAQDEKAKDDTAKGAANEKTEPWEISKLYDAAFLRTYLQDHEALPKPIVVPSVSGKVLDPDGKPASGVSFVSYTPRHWVDLDATLALNPHNSGAVKKSKQDGTFGLPERSEPYRVLLVHESGVANVSHEELLRANGVVTLQKWASVTGTLKLGGKPQADEAITLEFDTLPWSYSRGGPRLTTTYRATTDKDGNFSFDRVPPLGGLAHHRTRDRFLGHAAVYDCESGLNTHIEIGAGITVTGKLSLPEHQEKKSLRVYARNQLLPIPYPRDWTDKVSTEERDAWRTKWLQTAEGYQLDDKNFVLMNSSVPGSISDDGTFTIYGVPERPMVLEVVVSGEEILLEKGFDCTDAINGALDLGTVTASDNHDHHHEVHQEGQGADKSQLPRLIVRTIDSKGTPVRDIGVLFYDRDSRRARQKEEFEMVNKRTDESGVADLGVMPNSFGCLQLSPSNQEFAKCYTLISATMTECSQAKPPRANVQTEIKNGILTVTFTMTPHVDLEFNIVDDATNEIVFWSEISYQDPTTNRWWQFGLVDGSQMQHNFIPISPQITRETMRISALGYETKVFRLPGELDRSQPIRRDVRLKPMPDVELKVLLPDGNPAEKAQLKFHYPNGLECLQVFEWESNLQGIVTTKFPPHADIGSFRLEHPDGTAELPMQELLDEVKQSPEKVIRRNIQLRKSKQQKNAGSDKAVTTGDHTANPASWLPARPQKTTVTSGSATILDDHSIRLEGDAAWQEVTTHQGAGSCQPHA